MELLDEACARGLMMPKVISRVSSISVLFWGAFEDPLSSDDRFCSEVRSDFRETRMEQDDDDSVVDTDVARAISLDGMDDFSEFLAETPT